MDVLPGFADGSALVQIENAANLAIVDSLISNIPGTVIIRNSSIQVLRSNFILNSGDAAGALTIESSQVGILSYDQHRSISVQLLHSDWFPLPQHCLAESLPIRPSFCIDVCWPDKVKCSQIV